MSSAPTPPTSPRRLPYDQRADCTIAAGFMREHQTRSGGPDRISTTLHGPTLTASSRFGEWKTRSFASPPSWISPIHGLLPRRRLPEQRCFSRATSDEGIRGQPVRFKYVLDAATFAVVSSSLSLHEEWVEFERVPILLYMSVDLTTRYKWW